MKGVGPEGARVCPASRYAARPVRRSLLPAFLKKGGKAPKDNAWFVGFAPPEHPEIVVAGLYEGGEKSYYTAALVRDVLKAWYDKKVRLGQSAELSTPAPSPVTAAPAESPAPAPAAAEERE